MTGMEDSPEIIVKVRSSFLACVWVFKDCV